MNRPTEIGEPFKRISVQEARAMIAQGNVQVVDVRQQNEWDAGHIPEAVHIPLDRLMARSAELAVDKPIIFVCAVGQRSAVACEMAAALGREQIYNLEGGTEAWIKSGLPVARG